MPMVYWNPEPFKKSLNAKLARNMDRACKYAEAFAKIEVPVDTGFLRSTIGTLVEVKTNEVVGYLKADADYALPVETGTSRMAAHPYLRPAVFNHASEIAKIIKGE